MTVCENAGRCGGCFYQGIDYEEQLKTKEDSVYELISPVVQGDFVYEPIIPSPIEYHYRNKMEFSFGDSEKGGPLTLGLHQKKSFFNILNADDCRLCHPDFGKLITATREYFTSLGIGYFHKKSHTGYLRHLLVRRAVKTGEILVDLVSSTQTVEFVTGGLWERIKDGNEEMRRSSESLSEERLEELLEENILKGYVECLRALEENSELEGRIAGILHTKNDSIADAIKDDGTTVLYGEGFFYEELLGLRFKITPFSFFQTNTLGAERLYSKIREYAGTKFDKKPVIYDLYSGTGTITQLMSPVAERAVGVEIVEEAVESARDNARENNIENCSFIAGDVLKVISEGGRLIREDGSEEEAPKPDLIILDPPRDGIHPKALKKILDYAADTLIYVACKPKSLARDLLPIQEAGYKVLKVCCVDMFPQTNNCETVCLLSKGDVKSQKLRVEFSLEDMDTDGFKKGATYNAIRDWIKEKYGYRVTNLNIAQVKQKHGIIERENYNKPKSPDSKQPGCPEEKIKAIEDAMRHFQMI